MPFVPPTNTIYYSIEKAIKTYRKFAQKQLSKVVPDITLDQALLLLLISEQPNLSQVDMADLLFKDHASLTRMINLLKKNGYLYKERHPTDGRRSFLRPTEKARISLGRLRPVIAVNRNIGLSGITGEQKEILQKTLETITENCTRDPGYHQRN
jgi:DNA-binding MarR family transcriptional regulator